MRNDLDGWKIVGRRAAIMDEECYTEISFLVTWMSLDWFMHQQEERDSSRHFTPL